MKPCKKTMKKIFYALSFVTILTLAGCSADEENLDGNSEPVVKAAFSTDRDTYVAGDEVSFTDETVVENCTVSGYEWDFGIQVEGNVHMEKNPVVRYPEEGTFTVSLTVSTLEGISDTFTKDVVVGRLNLAPVADFSYTPEAVYVDEAVKFSDLSSDEVEGALVSWQWTFGDGTGSDEQNPEHVYQAEGKYTVTLTVKDSEGLEGTVSKEIEVQPEQLASILWSYPYAEGGSLIGSSPAVGDKYVYALSTEGNLVAVDRQTGEEKWRFSFIDNGVTAMSVNEGSSPSVDPADGSVYVAVGGTEAEACKGFRIDGETGDKVWEVTWPNKGSRIPWLAPVVTDDYIAVANRSTSGSSYVWDKTTGKKVASSKLTGVGGGICATKAGQFFFAGTGSNGFLPIWIDNLTGKFAVIPDIKGAIGYGDVSANGVQPMVDSRGYLYVGSSSDAWCFNIKGYDGSSAAPVVWFSEDVTGGQICKGAGFVMSADGLTIYAGSQGAEVFAVDASTGSRKWGVSLGANVQTVPAIDNLGNIHVCDLGGGYTIVSPEGKLLFSINLGDSAWASPAIADDGTVYVAAEKDGVCTLYAFKVEGVTSAADSDWSQFGGNARRTGMQK